MLNILLVEDDEVDVMNVQRAFRKNKISHPITVANDGLAALNILRNNTVSTQNCLIILDLNMPRMGGIEFLQQLRVEPEFKIIPVVVLTTSAHNQDRLDAYQLHVAGYFLKPVNFNDFVELVSILSRYWVSNEML